ncbi:MAG TPA: arsenic resistance N-acetyltransferase ArsN2 [Rudaea sp.]|jgi:amino-acid N-acetyltransferase|uniref:arsenic resistance N-acetyltransferase ArsN2 n=1 Tax=Rudaea sp. TaxID=2136325 RepID=UPI002F92C557
MRIQPAVAGDLGAIRALLTRASLPSLDLDAAHLAHFHVARAANSDALIGIVGLEPYPPFGLLRSLAVAPEQHGASIGTALVDAIEAAARGQGIVELVLLTTTAERFFAQRGYTVIARDAAPAELQSTHEFVELCPASSVCMRKSIQP